MKKKRLTIEQQIKMLYGEKRPYCKVCDTDMVLAKKEEVEMYKKIDTTYELDFVYVPDCDCWLTNSEYMEVR